MSSIRDDLLIFPPLLMRELSASFAGRRAARSAPALRALRALRSRRGGGV